MSSRSNDRWLAELGARDESAIEDLRTFVLGALRRGLASRGDVRPADLEDFAQDAVLRILDELGSFRGDSRFTTWVTTVAIRTALATMRRRAWGDRSLDELRLERATEDAGPAEAAERSDLHAALDRAIDTALTDRQRTLIRAELAGMPTVRLVEELGTNANALYKLYHDARKKLRTALAAAGFGESDVRRPLARASNA